LSLDACDFFDVTWEKKKRGVSGSAAEVAAQQYYVKDVYTTIARASGRIDTANR
jgi:hypothetical protein